MKVSHTDREAELPADVVAAINENRRIEAIKLLRAHRDLDLAEAKRLVDLYAAQNPRLLAGNAMRDEGSGGKLVIAVIVVVGLYLAWQYSG